MKKAFLIFTFSICLLIVGCSKKEEIIEIKEEMFISQCNDIYLNPNDYKGKTIKLEGFYDESTDQNTNEKFHFVIRNGPGCCGNDGVAGFQFTFNGDVPKLNDWIEVVGTVELVDDNDYIILNAKTVNVLSVRGAETVSE